MRFLAMTLISLVAFSASMSGQTFGEITGEIRDSSGGAVVGAVITVTNKATSAVRSAVTNDAGIYSFPSMQPGAYELKVAKDGFRAITQSGLDLQVQQTARVDLTLQVGQVTEVIEVTSVPALVTTENATLGLVIENRRVVDLPLNGRNFLQLVALSPNVTYGFGGNVAANRQGGTRQQTTISIAGQRSVFNHYTLDGLENTNVEANTYVFLPSIDALQEFKVQTGIYPAEFGRGVSHVNVSTKSGGNDYHGTLFEFFRNDKLDATTYAFTAFRPENDPFRWNQYGFTLGGPVWIPKLFNGRNRLFFATNFEGFRDRKQLRVIASVAPPSMRAGDFSGSAAIFDPLTHAQQGSVIIAQPFPGNRIPQNRIHRISSQLLEYYPAPNQTAAFSNYQAGAGRIIDKDQFNQRIDWIENASSTWFGRFSKAREKVVQPGLKLNGVQILTDPWQAMLSNTRVFSPTVVNEFRFGVSRFQNNYGNELAFKRDVLAELKIPGIPLTPAVAWGIPNIGISGFSGFGSSPDGPWLNNSATFQWSESISWVRGKHNLRLGAEIRRDRWNVTGFFYSRPQFTFEGLATQNPAATAGTGVGFADYLLGNIRFVRSAVNGALAQFRGLEQYYYVDDTWKVRPNLTINFGLRYENAPPWSDRSGLYQNLEIPFFDRGLGNLADQSRHPTLVRVGSGNFYDGLPLRFNPAIKVARDGRLGDRLINTDHNDFAPRLGIAWSPIQKWTLRAGAGFFYAQDSGEPKMNPARNLTGTRLDEANIDFWDLTWDQPFRSSSDSIVVNTPAVFGVQNKRRTPYVIQYLFNVQRELRRDTVLELGYLGSASRKLEQYRSFNYAEPSPTGSISSRVPYPEFGRLFFVDTIGKATYNSLAVKLQRRFSGGLTSLVAYTWGKSIDTGSGIRPDGDFTLFTQDEFCVQCDRAASNFNTLQRFTTSTLYELPFGKEKRFLKRGGPVNLIAGGWQIGSIVTLQTGFPLTVMAGRDQCNCGHQMDRVNATGQATALPRGEQDPQRFFNTGAYVLQPFGSFGNIGRNTLTGPGVISWDFSAIKNLRFGEQRGVEFRVEVFNFPNHPNWADPDRTFTSVNFGRITSTRTSMRELQLGLKLHF
jgi:hypothetical protein